MLIRERTLGESDSNPSVTVCECKANFVKERPQLVVPELSHASHRLGHDGKRTGEQITEEDLTQFVVLSSPAYLCTCGTHQIRQHFAHEPLYKDVFMDFQHTGR